VAGLLGSAIMKHARGKIEAHLFALVDPTIVLGLTRPTTGVTPPPMLLHTILWLGGALALILSSPSTRHLSAFLAAVASDRLSLMTRRAFAKVAQELRQSDIHQSTNAIKTWTRTHLAGVIPVPTRSWTVADLVADRSHGCVARSRRGAFDGE
jgi:hypothetical protein